MNTEQAFLEHLLENPSDWSARLALADWLVERGDPRGELVRLLHVVTQQIDPPGRPLFEERVRELLKSGVKSVGPFWTNSIGMTFACIPPGTFLMGSPHDEPGRYCCETQHKVILTKGFLLGIHLVTQEQWQMVMGDIPAHACGGEPTRPVEEVSWDDCQEFLKRLTEMEGKTYRLPTEAEWEYACRAGTTTPFYCGETISTAQGDYRIDYHSGTRPVSSLPANAFGLCDMHGFVWEWCSDWYDGGYPKSEVVDPKGPATGDGRVMRGGTYPDIQGLGSLVRSAHRINDDPDKRTYWYGFRAARTITGTI